MMTLRSGFLHLEDQLLWMDMLYKSEDESIFYSMHEMLRAENSNVWLTNVTLQGDGDGTPDCFICGVLADRGSVYVKGAIMPEHYIEFANHLFASNNAPLLCCLC